jgi:hypothetical protein
VEQGTWRPSRLVPITRAHPGGAATSPSRPFHSDRVMRTTSGVCKMRRGDLRMSADEVNTNCTRAGGGTLVHRPGPPGKRIFLLGRGYLLPRERHNPPTYHHRATRGSCGGSAPSGAGTPILRELRGRAGPRVAGSRRAARPSHFARADGSAGRTPRCCSPISPKHDDDRSKLSFHGLIKHYCSSRVRCR